MNKVCQEGVGHAANDVNHTHELRTDTVDVIPHTNLRTSQAHWSHNLSSYTRLVENDVIAC